MADVIERGSPGFFTAENQDAMSLEENNPTDDLGISKIENLQIEAQTMGATREEVASVSRQNVEDVPEIIVHDQRDAPVYAEDTPEMTQETEILGADLFHQEFLHEEPTVNFTKDKLVGQSLLIDGLDFTYLKMQFEQRKPGKRESFLQKVNEKYARDLENTQEALSRVWNTNSVISSESVIQGGSDVATKTLESQASPIAPEIAVVDELKPLEDEGLDEPTFNLQEAIARKQAIRMAMANDVNKATESAGWFDTSTDIAGLFFPMGETIAKFKAVSSLNDLGLFEAKTFFTNWVEEWHKLPLERRQEYLPEVTKIINETSSIIGDPNSIRAGNFLNALLSGDPVQASRDLTADTMLDFSFGLLDFKDIGAVLTKVIKTTNEVTHIAKSAKEMANKPLSEEVLAGSVVDKNTASVAGTTQQDSVNSSLPYFHDEAITPSYVGEASGGVSERLNDIQRQIDGRLMKANEEAELLLRGAVSKVERQYAEQSEIAKMDGRSEDILLEDDGVFLESVRVAESRIGGGEVDIAGAKLTKSGKRRSVIEYELVDRLTGAKLGTGERQIVWGVDDATGTFVETVEKFDRTKWWIASPSVWAQVAKGTKNVMTDFFDSYKTAARLEEIGAKTRQDLQDIVDIAIEPIKGDAKALTRVEMFLQKGDEWQSQTTNIKGKVFTREELTTPGNNTIGGDEFLRTDAEVEAYFGIRRASDAMWATQNDATRKSLTSRGFRRAVVQGEDTVGKPFDTLQGATSSIGGKGAVRILDGNSDTIANFDADKLAEAYDQGNKLVRLREPHKLRPNTKGIMGEESVEYAWMQRENIGELPQQVIHYRVGYVPKINEDVTYLLKRAGSEGVMNNAPIPFTKTLKFFGSKKQGDDALQSMFQRKVVNTKKWELADEAQRLRMTAKFKKEYELVPDRALSDDAMLGEPFQGSGGLFHGQRSSDDILYGTDNLKPDRVSPLEAIQRQANHLGNYVTKNEWRLGEQQRWLNTVRELLPNVEVKGFDNTLLPPKSKTSEALQKLREQIDMWSGVPTSQETAWQKKVQGFHDLLLEGTNKRLKRNGKEGKAALKSLLWLKHFDLPSASKAAVFHSSLGLFNPVQLYVQAQAAVVALSKAAFAEGGMQVAKDGFVLTMADMIKDPQAKARFFAMHAKDNVDLQEMQEAFRLSGLFEGIRTNADIVMMEQGFGSSLKSFKKNILEDKGLMFYRSGEKINRAMSFSQAFREFKRLNGGKKVSVDDLDEIMHNARVSMLELGRSNAARWQGGPDSTFLEAMTGMMFQFGQVGAKTLEKAAFIGKDKGLSAATKRKILIGQLGFFGAAGIPMGSAITDAVSNWTDTDLATMDPAVISAWNGGASELIANHFLGMNANISERGALASGLNAIAGHALSGGSELDFYTATPAISTGSKVYDAMGAGFDIPGAIAALSWPVGIKNPDLEGSGFNEERLTKALSKVAALSGLGRSYLSYKVMKNHHKIMDRYGRTIANGPYSTTEELAVLFGLKNIDEVRARDAQFDNMDIQEQEQVLTKDVMALMHDALVANGGDMFSKSAWLDVNDLLATVEDPILVEKVRASLITALEDPTSLLARENAKAFKTNEARILNGQASKQTTFTRSLGRTQAIPSTRKVVEIEGSEE